MTATLGAEIDAALAARRKLRGRPIVDVARALAAAARRWQDDAALAAALPETARLDDKMVAHVLPLVAEAIDADALVALHAREATSEGPALVAHVLASNVPALAVPAIALGCLAGAAVVVKSGRADTVSAPAFRRALAAVDADLAATVVTAYWPGGAADVEDAVLSRADVVVATGGDTSTSALVRRFGGRVVAHGERASVAVLGPDASAADAEALAWDVVRYEQRGCLSPHVAFVAGDAGAFAGRLHTALDQLATVVPPGTPTTAERAAARMTVEEARFTGVPILEGRGGTVMVDERRGTDPAPGCRTVRVVPVAAPGDALAALPDGAIECVGVGGGAVLDVDALRRLGVARLCRVGRMQRPRIDWPRGQRPALGSLFRGAAEPRIQVEP